MKNKTTNMKKTKSAKKISKETNKRWQLLEVSHRYKMAVAHDRAHKATCKIKEEVLDGIFLELNARNQDKPRSVQNRVLRRIVEKRQAQVSARVHGTHAGRFAAYYTGRSTRRCMDSIARTRNAMWC